MQSADRAAKRSRGFVWRRLVVSLALLFLAFHQIEEPGKTWSHLRSAHLGFGALVLGLMFLELVYGGYKWLVLLRCGLPGLRIRPILEVQFLGSFLGQFLPGGGTDLVKVYGLTRATGDLAFSLTSLLVDRLIGLLTLMAVVLVGLTWEASAQLQELRVLALAALFALAAAWWAIMNPGFRRWTDRVLLPEGNLLRRRLARGLSAIGHELKKVYASLDAFRERPGVLAYAVLLGVGMNLLRVAVMMAAAMALGVEIAWTALLFIVPCVVFAMILPISMAGWGVRELGLVGFLQMYGVPGEQALATSLLIGALGAVASLPGVPLFVKGWRRVQDGSEEGPEEAAGLP